METTLGWERRATPTEPRRLVDPDRGNRLKTSLAGPRTRSTPSILRLPTRCNYKPPIDYETAHSATLPMTVIPQGVHNAEAGKLEGMKVHSIEQVLPAVSSKASVCNATWGQVVQLRAQCLSVPGQTSILSITLSCGSVEIIQALNRLRGLIAENSTLFSALWVTDGRYNQGHVGDKYNVNLHEIGTIDPRTYVADELRKNYLLPLSRLHTGSATEVNLISGTSETLIVLTIPHALIDNFGLSAISEQWDRRGSSTYSPVDRAFYEAQPKMRQRAERAMEYRRKVAHFAACGSRSKFRAANWTTLDAPVEVTDDLETASSKYGVTESTLLLALYAKLLSFALDTSDPLIIQSESHNRFSSEDLAYVGTLVQPTLIAMAFRRYDTIADMCRATFASSMRAYTHALYDPSCLDETIDVEGLEQNLHPYFYNYARASRSVAATEPETRPSLWSSVDQRILRDRYSDVYLHVSRTPGSLTIRLRHVTAVLDERTGVALLKSLRLLIERATRGPVPDRESREVWNQCLVQSEPIAGLSDRTSGVYKL